MRMRTPLVFGILFSIFYSLSSYATVSQCDAQGLEKKCELSSYTVNGHSFWLPGLNNVTQEFHFQLGTGSFAELPNNRAKISGTIVNENDPNQQWSVSLYLAHKSDWSDWSANGGSYKDEQNIVDDEYLDWDYYIIDTTMVSKLTGQGSLAGSYLNLTHMPSSFLYGFQIGEKANSKNGDYGMACWFYYSGKVLGEVAEGHEASKSNSTINIRSNWLNIRSWLNK
ncbi:hypothetical protein N8Z47_01505 [Salibacteraceae bacterium]|nr:hypothetical protein [Salibacteraceae bacterium]